MEIQFSDGLQARLVGMAGGWGKVLVRELESWRTHLGAALQDWCWRKMEKALFLALDLMEKSLGVHLSVNKEELKGTKKNFKELNLLK